MANTEPTLLSIASSATLKHAEPVTNRPILRKRLEIRRHKRGFSGLSREVTRKVYLSRIGTTKLIHIRLIKYNL